jgi:hypothetical protein
MAILRADNFRHHIDFFNDMEPEDVVNLIPDSQSWDWLKANIPLFTCPDSEMERIYYYRWWTFRKHIKQTPAGVIITEFITPVRHAGTYNSISCALGHHIAEGRWLRDRRYLDEYIRFWFRSNDGKPEAKFHNYSSWVAAALYNKSLVDGDAKLPLELLDELAADYLQWETEKLLPSGLFWQFDVRDGMEESISGSRKHKNARPTINSYMYANALAVAAIARMANRADLVRTYEAKAAAIKQLAMEHLWDSDARFFKAQTDESDLSDAREAIGFIPWCFRLPDAGYEDAWAQFPDPKGFDAPFGITTAERRHPQFRSHGVGKCEWDGAVWPFATSQTLDALANVLRYYSQSYVTREHYFQALRTYVKSQHREGRPYIGEYLDETTGDWLKGDNPRSRNYNHSTFCDLIITGLIGLVPSAEETIEISPLLPPGHWDWFCLDRLQYHGQMLTILWDRVGTHFNRGKGLSIFVNEKLVAQAPGLAPLKAELASLSSDNGKPGSP